jgi:hypothetical protein
VNFCNCPNCRTENCPEAAGRSEQEEHIKRLEWRLRDLGGEHKRVSELLAAAVARERELKMELEDLRMLAEDLLEDVVNSETIEFARMRARQAIRDYFKEERR